MSERTKRPITTYETSPIKRPRRTKAEIEAICQALYALAAAEHPTTNRHLFYQLANAEHSLIAKTEKEYKGTVCRLLTRLRREKRLPFEWLSDNTRWIIKPPSFDSMEAALRNTAETYRRALWTYQSDHVEIWCEKDAVAGILAEETRLWDVPLMVVRGYSSLSYLHGAAERSKEYGRPVYVYYFGDHDPSGVDIARFIEHELREFAPDTQLHFSRVAVTPEQIRYYGLPTRPTKETDSRSKGFTGESVDLDAMSPRALRGIVNECIQRHIDTRALRYTERIEAEERRLLDQIVAQFGGAA